MVGLMRFDYPLTILANTEESDPTRLNTPLDSGQLKQVSIEFPWGCAGLAHVRVFHYEHQLYPTNPDKWIAGNDITIVFECAYDLTEGHEHVKIEGYNEDDFYPHTVTVSFVVIPVSGLFSVPSNWVEG